MILLKIFDVKDMMLRLLVQDSFDTCLLEEAQITTFARLVLNGRRNRDWYDQGEKEINSDMPDLVYWKEVKPFLFQYIKGKKTPTSFQITLRLGEEQVECMLPEVTKGMADFLIHFRFEKEKLSLVTGCSYHDFTLDKTAEYSWDEAVQAWLVRLHIGFEK